ncbi:MAG: DUF1552 domain-containing protein [Capsulimonadales bacterium]|nr:DUF1552 domain-containing protein [Capsulimonadales bacterium]
MSQHLDRRTFLRGVGTVLSLPLLEAMMPTGAMAQTAKSAVTPKRIAFLFVPNGVNMSEWTPKADGPLTLSRTLEPLAKVKDSINVLTGLTQDGAFAHGDGGGDHARSAAAWLTGCHPTKTSGANIKAGISADQLAARYLGRHTPFPSIELGCERGGLAGDCDSGYSCAYSNTISWRTEATPMAKETDPRLVFERLFTNGSDEEETEKARALRQATDKSILDFVMEDARTLRNQLGTQDRRKLDEYFEGVREVERRLQWVEKANAERAAGNTQMVAPSGIPSEFNDHIRLMGDMMVLAFQADLTRIATYMFANEGSNRAYRLINIPDGHHDLSHHGMNAEKLEKVRQINRFHVEQLAYILEKMKSIKEGNGSLLDNTLLVYGGGISDGDRHNHDDLPLLLAGGAAMGIKTGRHIRYKNGTPMTNLLLTMLDKVGVPADQIKTLGDSTGRLQVV